MSRAAHKVWTGARSGRHSPAKTPEARRLLIHVISQALPPRLAGAPRFDRIVRGAGAEREPAAGAEREPAAGAEREPAAGAEREPAVNRPAGTG